VPDLARAGVEGHVADIIMTGRAHETALARRVLEVAQERRAT